MQPPLGAGFKSPKAGGVKVQEGGDDPVKNHKIFYPALERTHRIIPCMGWAVEEKGLIANP